ncbi:MAG: hypothetical protein GXP38_09875, partial [Chloroflexi bacterium]|nr:hypothetical protein [Chloroflexota bacterium]
MKVLISPRNHRLLSACALTAVLLAALLGLRPAAAAPLGGTALLRVGDGRLTAYRIRPGELITIPVTLFDGVNVGTVTAVIEFDPAVLRAVACERATNTAFSSGYCNLYYTSDSLKFNAIAPTGANSDQELFYLTFQGRGDASSTSTVTPR